MDNNPEESSDPLLSTIELSPVLVPYFLAFFMYLGIFTNFPLYLQLTQNLSDVEVVNIWAIISGVALLIGALTRLPAGLLSDKIGRVNGFLVAYSMYFITLFVVLLFNSTWIYVLAMGLLRFGSNMVAMTGRAVVSTANRDRGLKNGLLSSMTGLGSFVGPYSLGYVLDHYPPNYILYVAIGIVIFDLLLFFTVYKGIDLWLTRNEIESDLNFDKIPSKVGIDYKAALSHDGLKELFLIFFLGGLVYGLIQSIFSIYGYNILILSTTAIGLISGLGSLSQTIAAPVTGRLYLFVKDEYMRIIGWVIFVAAGIFSSLSPLGVFFYATSFFLVNIAFASYFTMEITRMSTLIRQQEFSFVFGIATSLTLLATAVAGFISPTLYNIIPEANFYVTTIISIVTLIFVLWTTPKWIRRRRASEISKQN